MRYFSNFLTPVFLIISCVLVGCGSKLPALKSYKMEIQQGNVVTSKMLLQLRPGMTKSQVRYIMGTPLIVDSFHGNRWDYFYQLRQQGKVIEKRRVILDFEKDLLTTVRGDVVAASDKSAETPVDTSARSVVTTKKPVEKPWFDMFKFWGSDESAVNAEPASAAATASEVKPVEQVAEAAVASSAASPAPVGAEAATAAAAADIASEAAVETESILKKKPESAAAESVNLLPEAEPVQPVSEAVPAVQPSVAEAVAATAPAAVVASAERTSGSDADTSLAIQAAVNAWADAWRNKNVKAYFAAYADTFKPENGLSKATWTAQRKQRLSGKRGDISLVLEDVVVTPNGNQASVQFFQKYASKVFSDEVTKQLELQFDAATQRWLIVREFVVANGKRVSEQKILAPEASSEHLDGVIEKIGF